MTFEAHRDRRYHYARGDKVDIVSGPYSGRTASVDSFVYDKAAEDFAYQVTLTDGERVTIAWEAIRRLGRV